LPQPIHSSADSPPGLATKDKLLAEPWQRPLKKLVLHQGTRSSGTIKALASIVSCTTRTGVVAEWVKLNNGDGAVLRVLVLAYSGDARHAFV